MRSRHLLRSPLHDRHVALGAKMADFGGWEMPIEYPGGGVLKEHAAVREARRRLRRLAPGQGDGHAAPGAAAFVNACLTNDLGRIAPGQAQYTLCCDDVRRRRRRPHRLPASADDDVFLVPNAANTAEVVAPARGRRAGRRRGRPTSTATYGVLAVQGPRSRRAARRGSGCRPTHAYMSFDDRRAGTGAPMTVCRTGYTGEHGYELVPRWDDTAGASGTRCSTAGADLGARPCGLGARDTLRTEMGYPLHGQDLSLDDHAGAGPLRVGGRLEQAGVLGPRRAGRRAGGRRRAGCCGACVAPDRGIPRPHMPVLGAGRRRPVGEVTSGTFSPTLRQGIGLALLDRAVRRGRRGRPSTCAAARRSMRVVKPPFVHPAGLR